VARKLEAKPVYKTKKEAQKFALQLLDRGMKVRMHKVRGGWSVGVY